MVLHKKTTVLVKIDVSVSLCEGRMVISEFLFVMKAGEFGAKSSKEGNSRRW